MSGKHAKVTAWRVGRGTPLVSAALGIVSWGTIALALILVPGTSQQALDDIGIWSHVRPDDSDKRGGRTVGDDPERAQGKAGPESRSGSPASPTSPATATTTSPVTSQGPSNGTPEPSDPTIKPTDEPTDQRTDQPTDEETTPGSDPPGNGDGRDNSRGPDQKP